MKSNKRIIAKKGEKKFFFLIEMKSMEMSTTDCVCVLRGEEVGYIILAQSVKESRVSSFLKRICAYRKSNSSSLGNEIYLNR